MKLKLSCPEGWSYIGWQRCILRNDNGNFSYDAYKALDDSRSVDDPPIFYFSWGTDDKRFRPFDNFFLIMSGEGFTLEDLADRLSDLLAYTVEVETNSVS